MIKLEETKDNTNKEFCDKDETITIPKGHFVCRCDLDAEEPYIQICHKDDVLKETKVLVPKALAYYLTIHFCGSHKMRNLIVEDTKREIRNGLSEILGFDN